MAGTNGEGPSLSAVEKRDLFKSSVQLASGMPVIAGLATSSLDEADWLCRQAGTAGCAAALVMPPSYFREASEAGIEAWFAHLLDRSPLPILLYNFPKRTGIPLPADMVRRLAQHPNMAGLKDSSGDAENLIAYAEVCHGKSLFVGDETLLADAMSHGWSGSISGAANSLPNWLVQIVDEWEWNTESSQTKQALILPALMALRKAAQPSTHKQILVRQGVLPLADVRLPLQSVPEATVDEVLLQVGPLEPTVTS